MIHNLSELRATWVHAFPTRAVPGLRVMRFGSTIVGVDRSGRIYTNMDHGRSRRFDSLRDHKRVHVSIILGRMGMLAADVDEQQRLESEREHRKLAAGYRLGEAKDFAELGVPLTPMQLAKLARIKRTGEDINQ